MAKKTLTLLDLATRLAKPFGVSVSSLTGTASPSPRGGVARLSFVPAVTPFEVVERVARHAGALACDGPDGNLVTSETARGGAVTRKRDLRER